MFSDHGCHGEVALGTLPDEIIERLNALPGEWLEYELETRRVVVRHAQPSSGPDLPVIVGELVQMLAVIPSKFHVEITGGDFFVHTYDTRQFVRLHVEKGGVLRVQWAQPDFAQGAMSAWTGDGDIAIDPPLHRLNGRMAFTSDDAERTAVQVAELADNFEGLYPQGDLKTDVDVETGRVEIVMTELNLDASTLVAFLRDESKPGTLEGRINVTSFGREAMPELSVRIVAERGDVFLLQPVLWPTTT